MNKEFDSAEDDFTLLEERKLQTAEGDISGESSPLRSTTTGPSTVLTDGNDLDPKSSDQKLIPNHKLAEPVNSRIFKTCALYLSFICMVS